MRNIFYIVAFGILIYLGISTVVTDGSIVGSYGHTFALFNHRYFGYLSYIYLFIFLYPLYKVYKFSVLTSRRLEIIIASIILFFALEILQAVLISNHLKGKLGSDFIQFVSPYIGIFGVLLVILALILISFSILYDFELSQLRDKLFSKHTNTVHNDIENDVLSPIKQDDSIHVNNEVKQDEDVDVLDEPSYIRKHINIEQNAQSTPNKQEQKLSDVSKSTHNNTDHAVDDLTIQNKQEQNQSQSSVVTLSNNTEIVKDEIKPKHSVIVEELEENKKLLESIEKGKTEKPKNFKLPTSDFLQKAPKKTNTVDEAELDDKIKDLIQKLSHFNIDGDVIRTYAGPVVSTFEFKPAANVKVSKILNLQDDLAMALRAQTIRIQAPIPGKDVVGIEIPNHTVETIYLRELIDSKLFIESKSPLTIILGKDIVGKPFITDLKKLPHLLIAGTTGSGKSVGINSMILSLLYKNSPDKLRLLMIDPKMLEFSIYNEIPHLLTPVITQSKQAVVALNNMVTEMERRYTMMSDTRTKNIENYNEKIVKQGGEELPYIVVIIDELADLMMTSGKDVEHSIARLAQMARAAGIHLIVATQRPSVDVVTGLIKANLPSRISYRVGQKVDSKIILDQQGAESLLGRGDMLFTPPGAIGLVRLHAPWSSEGEIEHIVEFIKSQREPNYDKSFLLEDNESSQKSSNNTYEELDPLYDEAKSIILSDKKTSISYLQRRLQIGYNKSARLIEQLENNGVLSSPNTKGVREIL